jgi:hypothetical protein
MLVLLVVGAQAALLARSSTTSAAHGKTREISSVITLLGNMVTDLNNANSVDKKNWDDYSSWSGQQETDKNAYLNEQKGVVMSAQAQKSSAEGQVAQLTTSLSALASDLAEARASIQEVQHMRDEEHGLHEAEVHDLQATIEAVNHAITVLQAHYDSAGLAQVRSSLAHALQISQLSKVVTNSQMQVLNRMVQDPDYLSAEHASVDYSQSSNQAGGAGVIETLKAVRSTLMENKQASIEKDNEARRQFEETKTAKEADIERMMTDQATKTNEKVNAESTVQTAAATISQGNADITTAEQYLSLLTQDRTHFQGLYNERLMLRQNELAATQAALDALQQVSVGNAVSAIQTEKRVHAGLLQADARQVRLQKAVAQLTKVGKEQHSASLLEAAVAMRRMGMRFDPNSMNPVKDLLRQLITRLEEELSAETSHKEWCDNEKQQSADAKAARETMITNLQAEIPQLNTQIATLGSEIEFATQQLASTHEEETEGKKVRDESKAAFEKAKADHDEVISALQSAVEALSAVTFVQTKARVVTKTRLLTKQPEQGNPFSEMGASQAGSAVEMLSDLLSRYTSARTQAITEEEQSVKAHAQFLDESEQFRQLTLQTKQSLDQQKRMKEDRLSDAESELVAAGQELQQVTQYIADLAPSCDDIRVSFEERKHRREAEIQALKEALQVLDEMAQAR